VVVCPLCGARDGRAYVSAGGRDYLSCAACALVWLTPEQRPDRAAELGEYLLHENDPGDAGYRKHLSKLTDRVLPLLKRGARGLDFGCGPGPAISVMLGEQGMVVADYDPFFADDREALLRWYDFVCSTEVVEHFHNPRGSFDLLAQLLKPGGVLGIMTRLRTPDIDFARWHYIAERSHVAFYAPETMQWIGYHYGWRVDIYPPDVVIFRNGDQAGRS
jgi:SAM-dependent methyltransferase